MKLQESLDKVQGHLQTLEDQAFVQLEFEWEGIKFHAATECYEDGGKVFLNARMGQLYFTAENAEQRTMAMERIYATNRGIDGKYDISKKGEVSFSSTTLTQHQLKGSELMGALTLILLESETHIRALKSHLKPIPA